MVEYSEGYREKARRKLAALDARLSPRARVIAKVLSEHFRNSVTKPAPR